MKRFWPKSLGAQLALLVALALGVAQAVNFALLLQASNRQNYVQTATLAIARLAETVQRTRTGQTTPEMLRGSISSATSPINAKMVPRADVAGYAREMLAQVGIIVGEIKAAEIPASEFQVQVDGNGRLLRQASVLKRRVIVVSAEIEAGRWVTTAAPVQPLNPGVFGGLIFQTIVLYGFVLLTVLWVGGRIGRPLAELRQAAERFDSRAVPQPVSEQGPSDIRRLIRAFNDMRMRMAGLLEEKDRMLGAIGHDLRTPLASLRVRSELVEDEGERARMAATIDDMNRTLDDILSLARLGRASEPEQRVDLPALIDSLAEEFEDLGADVTVEESRRLAVPMRANLIKRALRNLIENALKYGERARVRVIAEPGAAIVQVDDDGPGIPDHEMERMFEAFTRLEQSRSRDTGGSGLGLALARAIVESHGGALTLANRVGGGLRATLWLPVAG